MLSLLPRCVMALLEKDTEESRADLRAWLPPAAELMRITEYEVGWLAIGGCHPSLLCAQLHGERLGEWKVAVDVAECVLRVEASNPLVRMQALRLLGCARAALGEGVAACDAAERAAAEAAKAKYVWLEKRSLEDLLKWCEAGEAEGVRARLREVAGRMGDVGYP